MNDVTLNIKRKQLRSDREAAAAQAVFVQIEIMSPTYISGWIATDSVSPDELAISGGINSTSTISARRDVEELLGKKAFGFEIIPEKKISPQNLIKLGIRVGDEEFSQLRPIFLIPSYKDWETHLKSLKNIMLQLVEKAGFFDFAYYVSQVKEVIFESSFDAIVHFHETGWKLGLNPHPLFNTKYYLKNNTDVATRAIDPLFHFVFSGMLENRVTSPDFDINFYVSMYGSQIPAGISPIHYYIAHGFKNGHQPLPWLDAVTVRALSQQSRHVFSVAEGYRKIYSYLKTPHAAMLTAAISPTPEIPEITVGTDIIIPFYREPYLIKLCLESLSRIADELKALNCRVFAVLDSPEDEDSVAAFKNYVSSASESLAIEAHINETNAGFVASVNIGLRKAILENRNALLLNSDCVLAGGSLTEMLRAMQLDPMIGFINPRSNNATIATYPKIVLDIGQHFKAFQSLSHRLPEISYTPTCVGFCMLISHTVLANFGLLDVSYGAGYNEENDYVSRANRVGFRAAQANRAYAFHIGGTSFRHTDFSSSSNSDVLDARYPEYNNQIRMYFSSRAQFSEQLIEGFLKSNDSNYRVLLDISQIGGHPNGTSLMATKLIKELVNIDGQLEFHVVSTPQAIEYNKLDEIDGLFVHAGWELLIEQGVKFAHVIRMGQPFRKHDLHNVIKVGATTSFFMLDTIAYDCGYIATPELAQTWESTASAAGGFIYQSMFTRNQFERRFPDMSKKPNLVSYHSLDLSEYGPKERHTIAELAERKLIPVALKGLLSSDFVLIVGNHFAHKDVLNTFNQVSIANPQLPIVVIGNSEMKDKAFNAHGCVFLQSGDMATELMDLMYSKAKAVIFPSYYEGFGFPIFDALAQNRRLFIRENRINREIVSAIGVPSESGNVYFYRDYQDLTKKLSLHLAEKDPAPIQQDKPHNWNTSALEIHAFIEKIIEQWTPLDTYRCFEVIRERS